MPLLLPFGYLNSTCNLKSEKDFSVMRLAPGFELFKTPASATHWLLPIAFHPSRFFPLNNLTGAPQEGSFVVLRAGALWAVQLYVFPLAATMVPDNVSPCSVASNTRSLSSSSHCGGIVKLILPPLN